MKKKNWGADRGRGDKFLFMIKKRKKDVTVITIFICTVVIITYSAKRREKKSEDTKKNALCVTSPTQTKSLLMRDGPFLSSFQFHRDESTTTAGRKIFQLYQSSLMDWGTGSWQRQILMAFGKSNMSLTVMGIWGGIALVTMKAT